MSGTNQFVPFGLGAGSNVLSPADWLALAARLSGFQSGVAKSIEVNTALRQSSAVATMIAQFIADQAGVNVNDDGDLTTLEEQLILALRSTGRNNLVAITATGNFTAPVTGYYDVELWGGGGSGGGNGSTGNGSSGGGGGGGYGRGIYFLNAGDVVACTIGVGGSGSTPQNGASTSFGAHLSAGGGVQGPGNAVGTAAAGGSAGTGGSIGWQGGSGEAGLSAGSGAGGMGGAASGGGGPGGAQAPGTPGSGTVPGGGGGGRGSTTTGAGGAGGRGQINIRY